MQAVEVPTERNHGRLYGLLRRFRAWAGVILSTSEPGFVRALGSAWTTLDPERADRDTEGSP